jgi:hypothetical protein
MICNQTYSQELEPRSYSVIPKNTNIAIIGYSLSSGAIITDATSPFEDFNVVSHTATAGYLRTFALFGKLARVSILIPFVYMSGNVKVNGNDTTGTRTGFADARFKIGVNIFGSPALAPKDYQKFKEQTVLGASLVVSIPTGQYDKTKIVNLGANRWAFKPEIGFSYGYNRFFFETFAGVWLITSNNEFLQTKKLLQDPIYGLQAHVLYIFPFHLWIGLDGVYYYGGRSRINGLYQNDLMENSRIGGVLGVPINVHHSFKLQAHTGLETRSGNSFTIYSLAYQYVWF